MSKTVENFWNFIYNQKIKLIVMLNEDNEKGLELDENYFPEENKVFVFGTHEVSTLALL